MCESDFIAASRINFMQIKREFFLWAMMPPEGHYHAVVLIGAMVLQDAPVLGAGSDARNRIEISGIVLADPFTLVDRFF